MKSALTDQSVTPASATEANPHGGHNAPTPVSSGAGLAQAPHALRPLHTPIPGMRRATLLGAGAHVCGIALTVTAAWLIVAASFKPPILTLLTAIVAVRTFGLARPLLRYLERIASHNAALSFLAVERARVYHTLIPLTPARLGKRARGDVLAGVVDDLDDIAYAHIRVVVPLGALLAAGVFTALLCALVSWICAALVLSLVLTCSAIGALSYRLTLSSQHHLVTARAKVSEISASAVHNQAAIVGVGGVPHVLAQLDSAQERLAAAIRREGLTRAVCVTAMPVLTVLHTLAIAQVLSAEVAQGMPTPLAALLLLAPVALGEVVGTVPDAVSALARAHQAQGRLATLVQQTPAVAAALPAERREPQLDPERRTSPSSPTPSRRGSALRTLFTRSTPHSERASTDPENPPPGVPVVAGPASEPIARVTISKPAIHDVLFSGASPHPEIHITASADLLAPPPAAVVGTAEATSGVTEAPTVREPQPFLEPSAGAAIELVDVTAAWSDHGDPALPSTTVRIDAGEFVAIVGDNGVGKSTLLAVIARHLDPRSGTYALDDVDALRAELESVRSRIGVVDDDPHIMSTSVRENLRLAAPERDDDHLVRALRLAGLHEWFASLPQGLDTMVGHGQRGLSGGERTRFSVARALASGRPLLLLDEPVAHLDHPTAVSVLADVREAAYGRTVVIVSHRPEGLEHADRILELTHHAEPEAPVNSADAFWPEPRPSHVNAEL